MTQLMQLLQPLKRFPGSNIFELQTDGDLWHLTSTANPKHKFTAIEVRILRARYDLREYMLEVPDEPLKAMATSARQAKILVRVNRRKLPRDASRVTVDLRHPIIVNGATLHAYPIEIEDEDAALTLTRQR